MKTKPFFYQLIAVLGFVAGAQASDPQPSQRLTDLAALNIQDRSIQKLHKLVSQNRGTPREPMLLSRLADLHLEKSGITFRITEGIKDPTKKNKTSMYHSSLRESIRILTDLIQRFPNHPDASFVRFKRGKAFKELEEIAQAKADFIYLFQHDPLFEMIDSAIIDLADFCADANQHAEALIYLGFMIDKLKGSDYYPIALHKAAWSRFNLTQLELAIDLLKTEIETYYDRTELAGPDQPIRADSAFLESAFSDLALFYFEAINKKSDFASAEKGMNLFKTLDQNQKFFGTTVLKFAKLLKAYELMDQLTTLKDRMISKEIQRTETAEIALLIFQHQFERKNFQDMDPLLKDLKKIRLSSNNPEQKKKIETTLAGALSELHKLVIKNKLSTEIATLMNPLISLTQSVFEVLGEENPTAILSTFSLAETAFAIKNYRLATAKYTQLMNPDFSEVLEKNQVSPHNLRLRRISSRYQELKGLKIVPEKLTIRNLDDSYAAISPDSLKLSQEWVVWVDEQIKTLPKKINDSDRQSYLTFSVEAGKIIYEYENREKALERFSRFTTSHEWAPEAVTTASIVLDTLLKSQKWNELYDSTQKFLALKKLSDKRFVAQAQSMSADSHFRITLQTQEPKELLSRTKECRQKFAGTSVASECAMIEAKTELQLGNIEKAETQVSLLLNQEKDPAKTQSLLLMRIDANQKLGRFDAAIHDLNRYQTMTDFKDLEMSQAILQHTWFKRRWKEFDQLVQNKKICTGKNAEICERYRVVRILAQGGRVSEKEAYRQSVHGPKSLASVWALAALSEPKKLPFNDRLVFLQRISATWDDLHPLIQIQLVSMLQVRVSETVESIRISSPGIAPMTADETSIERRMRLTQEVDSAFAKTMKLPWLQIKIKTAQELGLFYERLLQDLQAIQTPEKLLKPFEQKIAEVKKASEDLQQMAHSFSVGASDRKPAAQETATKEKAKNKPISIESFLLSDAVKKNLPKTYVQEWQQGVAEKRGDYLFYLVSQMESTGDEFKAVSPILKGMILIMSEAPSEGYELIQSATDQPLKQNVIGHFSSHGQRS